MLVFCSYRTKDGIQSELPKIWRRGNNNSPDSDMPKDLWDEVVAEGVQSLVIPSLHKGNLKQCQNYRTISKISHPREIMLRVILNRLKVVAEELLPEEQEGFRPGRNTVDQIFNSRVIIGFS